MSNIIKYAYGEVFFVRPPYVGNKSEDIKTNMRLGERPEVVISSDEFNGTSMWRVSLPLTTHENDGINSHVYFYDNLSDIDSEVYIEEVRYRAISDLNPAKGSYYMYRLSDELMDLIEKRFKSIIGRNRSYMLSETEQTIELLMEQNRLLQNQADKLKYSSTPEFMALQNENYELKEELKKLKESKTIVIDSNEFIKVKNNITNQKSQIDKFHDRYRKMKDSRDDMISNELAPTIEEVKAPETIEEVKEQKQSKWTEDSINEFLILCKRYKDDLQYVADKYGIKLKSVVDYRGKFINQKRRGEDMNIKNKPKKETVEVK